jgi:two-component system sensor histidine kinase CiaH
MIQSAVLKLTLWYLGIILVLSALFSIALYRESSTQLTATADHQRVAISHIPLPIELEPRRTAFLQELSNRLDADQRDLLFRLLALNATTLLLGGGAAYALARHSIRPIQQALEAQGRFTADASHELRTPLTVMRTEIEVALRQQQLGIGDAQDLLASNLEEIEKLEALSAGLLRLARFEKGLDPAVVTKFPVSEIISAASNRYRTKLAESQIDLSVTVGKEEISGDQASLIELVAILLDNAIKYSPSHSSIRIISEPLAHQVKLSVVDAGVGIEAADLPHIFDRFYRSDKSRTKKGINGYGLGLSIAKRIIEVHNGSITVDSTPGHGSVFRAKLPVIYTPKKKLLALSGN